ncbi:MAG: hypothetical protein KAQ83_01880 [Nanoarchaeota archaeon]|nr:hypothetical protein [Nanoarchaeota archaeon]
MKKIKIIVFLFLIMFLVGCSTQSISQSGENTQSGIKEEKNILDKVKDTFSSDINKLETDFNNLNDENTTFFTNVEISKESSDIQMDFVIHPESMSKFILSMFTLGISLRTYEVTTNFDNLKINYLNDENQIIGTMNIPNKAIKDVYESEEKGLENNPYMDAFWELSHIMYDESIPELFPESVAEDLFGGSQSDAQDIAEAMAKEVTHLDLSCGYSDNWDADAEDDGIIYYIEPKSSDGTIVPLEGVVETKVYEMVKTGEWGDYEKGELIHSMSFDLKGNDRLQYFDTWDGYGVKLSWEQINPYMASSSDYGILNVKFTDLESNSFEAKIGDDFYLYGDCQIRES